MIVPLDGGDAIPLASGQDDPLAVVVDSTSAYWTNLGSCGSDGGACDGTVMSIQK
jgi:hypothetical protein